MEIVWDRGRGLDDLGLRIGEAERKFFDARALLANTIAPIVLRGYAENFASAGGRLGRQWPPLTQRYRDRKRRAGHGSAMLHLTGALFDAMSRDGAMSYRPLEFKMSVRPKYVWAVDRGSTRAVRPKGASHRARKTTPTSFRIPPRPFIAFSKRTRAKIYYEVERWIGDIMLAATFERAG